MKTRLLILISLLSLGSLTVIALGQVPEGSVSLEIVTTPEPAFSQIEYGSSYQFDVLVGNLNFDTPASGLVTFMEAAGVFAVDVDLKTRQDGSSMGWGLVRSAF